MGENFACAKLPEITVDGETRNLSSFLGYKLYGVNPVRSNKDTARLALAHEVAQYLVSEEVQLSRYHEFGVGPTLKSLINSSEIQSDVALTAINAQSVFAVAQTAVPGNVWTAPNTFYTELNTLIGADGQGVVTDAKLRELLEALNTAIIGSK
jgi:arabinogalactan oligomer/maltooligosaccharide transport system substrate-binding protein